MGLLHATSGWGRLTRRLQRDSAVRGERGVEAAADAPIRRNARTHLRGQLFSGRLASGRFAGGLNLLHVPESRYGRWEQ